jgi:hypothetical protein
MCAACCAMGYVYMFARGARFIDVIKICFVIFCMRFLRLLRLSFIFKVSQHFLKSQSLNNLMFIFCLAHLTHLALFLNFIGLNYAISATSATSFF